MCTVSEVSPARSFPRNARGQYELSATGEEDLTLRVSGQLAIEGIFFAISEIAILIMTIK